jgi:hypothetical protein
MGFPLERGSVEDGILTCHWHHARFDLESGCIFDLWADDVDGLGHDLGLVIGKAVHGQLAADVPVADVVRQLALFGAQNRDGLGVGLTILTALANLLPMLPEEEAYLALFHGARRVTDCCDARDNGCEFVQDPDCLSKAAPGRDVCFWPIASIRTHTLNGRYRRHSGHCSALARNGSVANDP